MNVEQFKTLKGKQILITGGASFIGSNLCETLLKIVSTVTCLDNFAAGHKKKIASFFNQNNFTFIEGDIKDQETCQTAVRM